MPYSFYTTYTCKCGATYKSNHYKEPDGCPACRRKHHAKRGLQNYRKRKAEGRYVNSKKRDPAYDGHLKGAPPSVYTSTSVIHLRYEHALCQGGCGKVTDIINGYCSLCRGNGANEAQCANSECIK